MLKNQFRWTRKTRNWRRKLPVSEINSAVVANLQTFASDICSDYKWATSGTITDKVLATNLTPSSQIPFSIVNYRWLSWRIPPLQQADTLRCCLNCWIFSEQHNRRWNNRNIHHFTHRVSDATTPPLSCGVGVKGRRKPNFYNVMFSFTTTHPLQVPWMDRERHR